MDNQKFFDSTYGSYSGFLSSNSNSSTYSMSLSDSELPEEPPSTSGCSSEFANSSFRKVKRKEKLQQYLKQLKQMVAPEADVGSSHVSTIGALKHVISVMQKNKEDSKNESAKCISICTPFSSTSESDGDANILSLKSQNDIQILVNTKSLKIMQVSPSLKKILAYPMDSWTGRDLTSFLHRKDVVTVNSSYDYEDSANPDNQAIKYGEDGDSSTESNKKVIYCRFRHYKALSSGFDLEKKDRYTSFQVTVTTRKFGRETFSSKQKQNLLLECRPLTSAYKNWSELPTDKKTFSTRHSLFCSYMYIHPNAIPLLGFLPQDMVGMSIFDFYHPEDFEQLLNIYKQVVNLKGTTFSSPKIRLRTHNGNWVYVKTEWSSFINPWSKRLEFIIGQHTVIKRPHNIDIFSPPQSQERIEEDPEEYQTNLRMIRKLLLQPVVEEARTVALNMKEEPTEREVAASSGQDDIQDEATAEAKKKRKYQSVSGSVRCGPILGNHSGSYEQLNYSNSIKRFLLSQPMTYSSSSDKRSGNDSYTDEIDSDEVPDFEVDIPPKPSSFCSSTKVLVSEKEDMVPSPSYQVEEIGEEIIREIQTAVPAVEEPNIVMSLTQQSLQEHTKRQEKLYLDQAKQDSNLVLLKMSNKYSMIQESSHGLKRGHTPDVEKVENYKSFKSENVLLHPTIPNLPVEGAGMKLETNQTKMGFTGVFGQGMKPNTGTMYHDGTKPLVQLIPKNLMFPPTTITSANTDSKPENVQWPYYPQSGISFYPQVMGGFYQPVTVLSYLMPVFTSTTDVKGIRSGNQQGIFTQAGNKSNVMSISDTSSGENTSSSLMYLLELNNSEIGQTKSKSMRNTDPPWLFGVHWTEGVQLRYTVPRRKSNRILKEDRNALKLMNRSNMVLKQMEELKKDLDSNDKEPTQDEEADYLFMIEPDLFKDDSSSASQEDCLNEKGECSMKFDLAYSKNISKKTKEGCEQDLRDEPMSKEDISMLISGNQGYASDQMDEQEKKSEFECDSLQKSRYNDSSVDMESTCSKSSNLTPSDDRSSDEKGSSMKESDSQSFKLSEGNKDSESENDQNYAKSEPYEFDSFFAKNPTRFKKSKKGFWLNDTIMNKKIMMEFTLKKKNDILLEDIKWLNEMNQSAVVNNQLCCLLDELKASKEQIIHCTCGSPAKGGKCLKCSQKQDTNSFIGNNFFESLFMPPLFPEKEDNSQYFPDLPDMEDFSDIIDTVE